MEAHRNARRCSPPASPPTSASSRRSADRDVLVCSDELNHASIIDGCRLSRAEVAVFRHGDLDHLDALLAGRRRPRAAIVVSDTVFSMDGDAADVDALHARSRATRRAARARRSPRGARPASAVRPTRPMCVRVGTLSKTLGALGGFVAGPGSLRRARSRTRPGRTSSRPRRHPPTPPPRSPRSGCCGRPKATRSSRACAATSTGCAPATRRRSSPSSAATRRAHSTRRARCSSGACSSRRSGRRPSRRARRACASRSRPRTPTRRSTASKPRCSTCSACSLTE